CRIIQRAWKRVLHRKEQRRKVEAELVRRNTAAGKIQRKWRRHYKLKWLMRDIRLKEQQEFKRQGFQREYAQIEIAFWWRSVRTKNFKRFAIQQLIIARKAAIQIQACTCHVNECLAAKIRGFAARVFRRFLLLTIVKRKHKRSMRARCLWRRFYLGIRRLPRPEDVAKIQAVVRRFLRRRKRRQAATDIQRVYRGVLARRIFVVKLARMYTLNAVNIQRLVRGHLARTGEVRQVLEKNHAAKVITKGLRTYVHNKRFTAMVQEARLRRVRFERMQREALLRQRAEASILAIFLKNRERAAKAIQVLDRALTRH
ncbi:unnamed protein product, partial [Sphacelaria rigidula]